MNKTVKRKLATKTKPGSQKASKAQSPGPLRKVAKAWHIVDFQPLFELSDDIRKGRSGPLRYVKSICTLSPFASDAETRHFERMRLLKSRPERHLLRSVLQDLTDWSAVKPFELRGFLVTSESRPATPDYLAAQLNLAIEDIKQALPILEQLGFLERIPMNDQNESKKPKRKSARKSRKTGGAKKTKKTTQKTKQKNERKSQNATKDTLDGPTERLPDSNGLKRFNPARSGKPSRNGKAKSKAKSKAKNKGKATHGLTAYVAKEKEDGKARRHKANAQGKVQAVSQGQSKGQGHKEPPSAPTTTPPLPSEPHVSDAMGGSKVIQFTAPHTSLEPAGGPQHPAVAAVSRGYDRSDEVFGTRVYAALGYRWDTGSPEGRREICSFASKWAKARASMSGLPPEVVDELGVRLIGEAKKIARRGKRNKRPGAVWCTIVDKLLRARLAEAM